MKKRANWITAEQARVDYRSFLEIAKKSGYWFKAKGLKIWKSPEEIELSISLNERQFPISYWTVSDPFVYLEQFVRGVDDAKRKHTSAFNRLLKSKSTIENNLKFKHMGLENSANSNMLYIFQGKIEKAANQNDPNAIERKGKFYLHFDQLRGKITGFRTFKGYEEGQKNIALTVLDEEGNEYSLVFLIGSGYWRSFSRTVPNIDFSKEVILKPAYEQEGDKGKGTLFIEQGGSFLKRHYTMDNMNGMPVAIPVEVNGETVYDYAEQNEFLLSVLDSKVNPEGIGKDLAVGDAEGQDVPF